MWRHAIPKNGILLPIDFAPGHLSSQLLPFASSCIMVSYLQHSQVPEQPGDIFAIPAAQVW